VAFQQCACNGADKESWKNAGEGRNSGKQGRMERVESEENNGDADHRLSAARDQHPGKEWFDRGY